MASPSKRVLITGAATGIGAAIAKGCAAQGYQVFATDIDADGLASLQAGNPGIDVATLDVADLTAWDRVVREVETRSGPIDVLINNAGVCSPGRCDRVSPRDDRLTVEVNLIGVMHGVRTLLPRFVERGRGHVINVASMAAFAPAPDLATYCATKHAVRAYTHSCALDHRHTNIHWTLACPSAVETPMLQKMRDRRAGLVVFAEKPMPPERFAREVVSAIAEPKRELLVPAIRGGLIRLLGLFPGLVARGVDDAEKRGRAALDREPPRSG
ncbi:MAG: SDR family NAD(P)-dependent oxidoreductase [Myxococcota bacterium]